MNRGKPAEAEAEFRKAVAIRQKLVDDNPSDIDFRRDLSYDYMRVAALQAWFGQDKELSSTCEKLLSLAKDTEGPAVAERAAKCCSLRQADPKRCEAALVLARRAVEHGKGSQWLVYFEMALGMAEYRSGHFAEADAALTAAMNDPGKNNRCIKHFSVLPRDGPVSTGQDRPCPQARDRSGREDETAARRRAETASGRCRRRTT